MSECTHDCSTCGQSCGERTEGSPFQIKPLHEGCRVGKVYGVVSGKGGVGKSMVTSQLAVALRREGYRTAILDADITGPSIPKAFGIHGRAVAQGDAIVPVTTATGIQHRHIVAPALHGDGQLAGDHGLADAALAGYDAVDLAHMGIGIVLLQQGLGLLTGPAALAAGGAVVSAFAHWE